MTETKILLDEIRGVKVYSDGSIDRADNLICPDKPADPMGSENAVVSKDIVLDTETGLWARLFIPQHALKKDVDKKKLPLLVYYHGGGFVAFNPASSIFHNLCNNMCSKLGIVVMSVAYRLAPEHRLPTAFDDSFDALKWIQKQSILLESGGTSTQPWLEYADVSNCFLMGGSAGGTIVHYMAIRACEYDLSPVKLKGLIPIVAFFGSVARSESEIRSLTNPDDFLTLKDTDTFWKLSLPLGADRDHPYCRCPTAEEVDKYEMPPCLVVMGKKDVLKSKQEEYLEVLEKTGKDVQGIEYENLGHKILFPEVEDEHHYSYNEMIMFMDKCIEEHSY